MNIISAVKRALVAALLILATGHARAQWATQVLDLKPGWNAVYLHVDASHDTLANMVAADPDNPILEVWLWSPAPNTVQFVQNPQTPTDAGSQWASWNRLDIASSRLHRLVANSAYLVRVGTNVSAYAWHVKGKPVAPSYSWTSTGLNFLGFSTPAEGPPSYESFLAQSPELQQNAEIYQYVGGDLGAKNPARLLAYRTTPVKRGQAVWIRSGTLFNRYFGPFELMLSGGGGIDFGDQLNVRNFRLRNLTAGALTVSMQLAASETPVAGQPEIAGSPALLVRGELNLTNLTYGYRHLAVGGAQNLTLAGYGQPGSEIEVVLGLNRSAVGGQPGDLLAGVLRFVDSLGLSQVDVPVTAALGSSAGLWVGGAEVSQVGQYLKTYERDADDQPVADVDGRYVVSGINTNMAAVSRVFPVRLIVHNPAQGPAKLLQRVYVGFDATTNYVVSTTEAVLHRGLISQARRVSAAHLPWSRENSAWLFNGRFPDMSSLTAIVSVGFNDHAANPFVHTYHPDHDNLDAAFRNVLPQGSESYSVQREITLHMNQPEDDFASLTSSGQTITGDYRETITVLGLARAGGTRDSRQFETGGTFTLNRIASVADLTIAP
jgi:hypothetical protein